MSLDEDLERIALQEETLRFERFDAGTAWEIGSRLKTAAEQQNATVAIDVTLAGQCLFYYAMPGATPNNADWIRRKRNSVIHFQRSSYAIGRQLERDHVDFVGRYGLPVADYATHGGCFPIRLFTTGVIGTITVSGLPQREDHALVVQVLAEYLNKPLADLALS
jgi:uncharacterized protein (UPF0303 family)